MDGVTLLRKARDAGLTVTAEGGRLRIRGPRCAERLARRPIENKASVLPLLRWGPLVPTGWPPSAWRGRLQYMARICMRADRARELGEWAQAVADMFEIDREVR